MPEQKLKQKFGWHRILWVSRIWMLLLALICLLFQGCYYRWIPKVSFPLDIDFGLYEYLIIALFVLVGLSVAWFLPLWGGLVIIIISICVFFRGLSEDLLAILLLPFLLFPPGLVFLRYGLELARGKRSQ
jgi:hypothetical protein